MSNHAYTRANMRRCCAALLILSLLTGCWDRMELEERAVVLGISVDTAGPEAAQQEDEISHLRGKYPVPPQDMIRVSVQIALPGQIPLGPGEGGGGTGGKSEDTVWVLDVVGHTLDDALMSLQQQISGRLFSGICVSLSSLSSSPEEALRT